LKIKPEESGQAQWASWVAGVLSYFAQPASKSVKVFTPYEDHPETAIKNAKAKTRTRHV
jgi:hypothetical protein